MKLTPAAESVYEHLLRHGSITALEAQAVYRIADLAGRICEVRRALKSSTAPATVLSQFQKEADGRRYCRYVLEPMYVRSIPVGVNVEGARPAC